MEAISILPPLRLLLASNGVGALVEFLTGEEKVGRVAFIPTAGEFLEEHDSANQEQEILRKIGCHVERVDIARLKGNALRAKLDAAHLIFVSGGNPFYLLATARESSFAEYLGAVLPQGKPYVGVSAGALLVGPSLEPCFGLGKPANLYGLTQFDGVGAVNFFTLCHYGNPATGAQNHHIMDTYGERYRIVPITDQQAVWVNSKGYRVVSSPSHLSPPDDGSEPVTDR